MAQPLVLVVDDEPDLVELVTLTLARMQLATQSAGDVAGAKKLLKSQHFDLCLTDMRLPDGDGLDLLEWMGTHTPGVPCAVITAHGNVESAVRALKLGAFDFVSKPLDLGVLRRIVSTALKLSQSSDGSVTTRTGTQLIGHAADHGAAARDDHAGGAQPGAGAHLGRVRHRQGTGGAHDPWLGSARRRAFRAGQLRRNSFRADGERILRPQARQLHRRGQPTRWACFPLPKAARCFSTKSPTCRCTCR